MKESKQFDFYQANYNGEKIIVQASWKENGEMMFRRPDGKLTGLLKESELKIIKKVKANGYGFTL